MESEKQRENIDRQETLEQFIARQASGDDNERWKLTPRDLPAMRYLVTEHARERARAEKAERDLVNLRAGLVDLAENLRRIGDLGPLEAMEQLLDGGIDALEKREARIAELEAQLAALERANAENVKHAAAAIASLAVLNGVNIAELRRDKERLEWLDIAASDLSIWHIFPEEAEPTDGWPDLRTAIDAALKEEAAWSEPNE